MAVAGYPEVHRVTEVRAHLESVLAHRLAQIIHELKLILTLGQRTVALVGAQGVAKVVRIARRSDVEEGHTGRVGLVQIQPRNSGIRGRSLAVTLGYVEDVIVHPAKAQFVDQSGTQDRKSTRLNSSHR